MTEVLDKPTETPPRQSQPMLRPSILGRVVGALLVLVLLGGGIAAAVFFMLNKPTARKRPRQTGAKLVEVQPVQASTHQVVVNAMGTVVPARESELTAEVSGQLVDVSDQLLMGGSFQAGQPVAKVDPADYELNVKRLQIAVRQAELAQTQAELAIDQRRAELARAQQELKLELGNRAVAQREYELLGEEISEEDRELVLRVPQLASARASLKAAESALESAKTAYVAAGEAVRDAKNNLQDAQLDLKRTTTTAPFDGVVRERYVDVGSRVSAGSKLARIAGTDEYWVIAQVPLDQLRWITLPADDQPGSTVRIYHEARWGEDAYRLGRVVRILPDLERLGRMARVVVSVADPIDGGSENGDRTLLLDSFVSVQIVGKELRGGVQIPRDALREDESVWIMDDEKKLEIRPVQLARKGKESIYVSEGLQPGEKLVTSDIGAPVKGMPLRVSAPATKPTATATGPQREGG
ncbi:MAG: efflux RND transporter periplasmic adaptor subunit [Phycisphaerae bacterium]